MKTEYTTLEGATEVMLSYAPTSRPLAYSLATMRLLMEALDNPERSLRIIHIAGTSGKTSTCYYIRGLLQAAGCKTGLTVSPHITAINERVQIDGRPLPSNAFLDYFNQFMAIIEETELTPSYYELTMAFAYFVFAKEDVDYAIIETGLGGLLDGSNVAEREDKICVIQRIGYDHTEILGKTLPRIALQKAGIIQEHNVAFVLAQDSEVEKVILGYAATKHAQVQLVKERVYSDIPVSYQYANWSLAYAVYEHLVSIGEIGMIPTDKIRSIKQQTPPGRFEIFSKGEKSIVLDGAHNPQKLSALISSVIENKLGKPTVIFSMKETNRHKLEECIATLAGNCHELILTSFQVGQDSKQLHNADLKVMHEIATKHKIPSLLIEDQRKALEHALTSSTSTILVTGSLYLVSTMRPIIVS